MRNLSKTIKEWGISLIIALALVYLIFTFIAQPVNILAGFFVMMLLMGSLMTIFLNYYATEMGRFLG